MRVVVYSLEILVYNIKISLVVYYLLMFNVPFLTKFSDSINEYGKTWRLPRRATSAGDSFPNEIVENLIADTKEVVF